MAWLADRRRNPTPINIRNSTQPRTSGSICDRPISPTVCSPPTPTSWTPAKTPGENFSPKPAASPRSPPATGPASVNSSEGWYELSYLPRRLNLADYPSKERSRHCWKLSGGVHFRVVLTFRLLNRIGLNCDSKRRGVSNDGNSASRPNNRRLIKTAN
jgi:hypothetical protein